ncbi:MAG TPA: hypothetical protein VHB79_19185 [Polyangiaceae bacterium]|nr:hypothetical protein [Polyangiaceae bacterium]
MDSAIAFAVIMLGASLLITVLTQTISTLLNMRAKDLQRALCDLVTTLHPGETAKAEELARAILQHPLLSETRVGRWGKFLQKYQWWIAGGVGALMFLGVLVFRHFECSGPVLSTGALLGALAAYVAQQSSQFTGLATALRLEEFREMLTLMSEKGPEATKPVAAAVSKALSAGETAEARFQQIQGLTQMGRESMTKLADILRGDGSDKVLAQLVNVALAGVGTPEQREKGLHELKGLLNPGLHAAADKLKALADAELELEAEAAALADRAEATVDSKLKELEVLFNAAMDRASQRFTAHSRVWTIGFSIALAFFVHLDAIALLKQLSSDAELRAKLVASSDAMMKQADKILAPPSAPAESATAPVGSAAAPAQKPPECVQRHPTVPAIYAAALSCPTQVPNLSGGDAGPFPTREDALEHIEKHATADADKSVAIYRSNLNALLQGSQVSQLFDNAASINGQLSRAGIDLLPAPYELRLPSQRELPGVLVAAALLSLGAPFWFNLLKTMTNLRPLVATREENDRNTKAKARAVVKGVTS